MHTASARLGALLMVAGIALLSASLLLRHALPAPAELRPELRLEPRQQPTQAPPFTTAVGGVTYTVKPLADYELWGLVVSRHDTSAWWDWIHKASNDHLNVVDLCVVFAENAASGGYVGLDYSSGQFVCYFETASAQAFQRFSPRALSLSGSSLIRMRRKVNEHFCLASRGKWSGRITSLHFQFAGSKVFKSSSART